MQGQLSRCWQAPPPWPAGYDRPCPRIAREALCPKVSESCASFTIVVAAPPAPLFGVQGRAGAAEKADISVSYNRTPPRRLRLRRPLVAIDVETTGLSISQDRIVELSCLKLLPQGGEKVLTFRLNPQRPISPEATAIHGISNAHVENKPVFGEIAGELLHFLQGCDLTGFNLAAFDLPLLVQELKRVGHRFPAPGTRIIDTRRIYLAKEPRSLAAAYQLYCGRPLQNAHTAEGDARAAAEILQAQISRYPDLPQSVEELDAFCRPDPDRWLDPDRRLYWREEQLAFATGKYRHRLLREIAAEDPTYIEWVLADGIPPEVVQVVREHLSAGRAGKQPEAA